MYKNKPTIELSIVGLFYLDGVRFTQKFYSNLIQHQEEYLSKLDWQ